MARVFAKKWKIFCLFWFTSCLHHSIVHGVSLAELNSSVAAREVIFRDLFLAPNMSFSSDKNTFLITPREEGWTLGSRWKLEPIKGKQRMTFNWGNEKRPEPGLKTKVYQFAKMSRECDGGRCFGSLAYSTYESQFVDTAEDLVVTKSGKLDFLKIPDGSILEAASVDCKLNYLDRAPHPSECLEVDVKGCQNWKDHSGKFALKKNKCEAYEVLIRESFTAMSEKSIKFAFDSAWLLEGQEPPKSHWGITDTEQREILLKKAEDGRLRTSDSGIFPSKKSKKVLNLRKKLRFRLSCGKSSNAEKLKRITSACDRLIKFVETLEPNWEMRIKGKPSTGSKPGTRKNPRGART